MITNKFGILNYEVEVDGRRMKRHLDQLRRTIVGEQMPAVVPLEPQVPREISQNLTRQPTIPHVGDTVTENTSLSQSRQVAETAIALDETAEAACEPRRSHRSNKGKPPEKLDL